MSRSPNFIRREHLNAARRSPSWVLMCWPLNSPWRQGCERYANALYRAHDEIAVVLLNQRVLAGLGNVYKSEVAFAAGVNPFRPMGAITEGEMVAMIDASHKYMRANVLDGCGERIVTYTGKRRTTRSMGATDRLWVYGRQGEECRRCGATILMRKQGEQARSTYWCPNCQPWRESDGQQDSCTDASVAEFRAVAKRASGNTA